MFGERFRQAGNVQTLKTTLESERQPHGGASDNHRGQRVTTTGGASENHREEQVITRTSGTVLKSVSRRAETELFVCRGLVRAAEGGKHGSNKQSVRAGMGHGAFLRVRMISDVTAKCVSGILVANSGGLRSASSDSQRWGMN